MKQIKKLDDGSELATSDLWKVLAESEADKLIPADMRMDYAMRLKLKDSNLEMRYGPALVDLANCVNEYVALNREGLLSLLRSALARMATKSAFVHNMLLLNYAASLLSEHQCL